MSGELHRVLEERVLKERIRRRGGMLTHEEEREVRKEFKQQQLSNPDVLPYNLPAGIKLIRSVQPYVQYLANRMTWKNEMREELYQEGCVGLLDAFKKYDPDMGARFLTYAKWWALRRMFLYLDGNANVARLPTNARITITRYNRLRQQYPEAEFGKPYEDFLTDAKHHGNDKSLALSRRAYDEAMPSADARHIPYVGNPSPFRVDLEISDKVTWQIPDTGALPDEQHMEQERKELVEELLATLPAQKREILKDYFGIGEGNSPHTLQQVGDKLGVTRERIRQVKEIALHKLRSNPRYAHLADYSEP